MSTIKQKKALNGHKISNDSKKKTDTVKTKKKPSLQQIVAKHPHF